MKMFNIVSKLFNGVDKISRIQREIKTKVRRRVSGHNLLGEKYQQIVFDGLYSEDALVSSEILEVELDRKSVV